MNVLPAITNKSGRRNDPPAVFLCLTGVFTRRRSACVLEALSRAQDRSEGVRAPNPTGRQSQRWIDREGSSARVGVDAPHQVLKASNHAQNRCQAVRTPALLRGSSALRIDCTVS